MKEFDCDIFCDRVISLFGDVGQVELSQKIGISQGVISAIKNKKAKAPASDTVFKIAKHFNVSADWLLGLSDIQTTDNATKDLCATLGLSDITVGFLSGKTITPLYKDSIEYIKRTGTAMIGDWQKEHDDMLSFTREMVDLLVEEQFNLSSHKETGDPLRKSLLSLLAVFFDRLRLPPHQLIYSFDGKVGIFNPRYADKKDELWKNYIDNLEIDVNMGEDWEIDIKSVLLTETIQDLNSYFLSKKNKALAKE